MIKTDGGTFYLTAGEACYIFKIDGGALRHVHFGKRVEPEDDLTALGFGSENWSELGGATFARDGKPIAVKLEYGGAQVLADKPAPDRPALGGGKTLVIDMRDYKAALRVKLYYTPYPRGGFSRRVEIYNDGSKSVTLTAPPQTVTLAREYDIISVGDNGEKRRTPVGKYSDGGNALTNFIAAAKPTASESHGDVYGFLCAYGDGAVHATTDGAATVITCDDGAVGTEIAAGGVYTLPEALAVYSDSGVGGMSRILHDVLRENSGERIDGKRRPTVLYSPIMSVDKMCEAAGTACELGCDVFAVDCGEASADAIKAVAEACKAAGIKFGVRVSPVALGKSSAAYIKESVKAKNGKFAVDMSDDRSVEAFIAALQNVIADCDAEYLMIDIERGGVKPFAVGMWRVRGALAARFPELVIEWGAVPTEMLIGQSLCYPPCLMRNVVAATPSYSLKTRFDIATFGCLGCELDPTEATDELKRAIRAQIFSYQDDAPATLNGDLYRLSAADGDVCLMSVAKDKSRAYAVCIRTHASKTSVRLLGLDEHNIYHIRELNKTFSGAALMYCGVSVPPACGEKTTFVLHLRQVADYE